MYVRNNSIDYSCFEPNARGLVYYQICNYCKKHHNNKIIDCVNVIVNELTMFVLKINVKGQY